MRFDTSTLEKRKPLWLALSDLFLDTELQEHNLNFIAKAMKTSDYSLAEIHDILMLEVFPVCIANLFSVAGEWAGFDEAWLIKNIMNRKKPNRFRQWMNKRNLWMIKTPWEKVLSRYNKL